MGKTIFEELVAGLDLDELKELKGFNGRYLIDIKNGRVLDTKLDEYKKNTVNDKGYIYHRLANVDGEDEVISLHRIIMRAVLEVDHDIWRKLNLVVDHRNDLSYDCRFENLQLLTQSENLKKRRALKNRKRFTEEEIAKLNEDFKRLEEKHGELYSIYKRLSKKYKCSVITIQNRYLSFKKAQ
ncbi:hypothetical protein LYSIN_01206 [Lysinibacillus sphaericus]|uniref:Uncharacterized protein n=1 Tax=Lysinibacillus sphaericus TaxID=1421 RepID=A0A2S5D026_LYSSH|nr:HNH endonuclease [Lysinibacillus sphaericus]POZ56423.1 hypothetical protein LYSIN_01206 [Lysinibacillus sphaericus]